MSCLGSLVLSNTYRDSVFLMKISSKLQGMDGIEEASAMMGTDRNKDLFVKSNLSDERIASCKADDLVIAIRAFDDDNLNKALKLAENMLNESVSEDKSDADNRIERLEDALNIVEKANVLMISCAGDYAKYEAAKGISNGMNIMLYSDNVSIEDELALKQYAHSKGLIVMGPDCGTSIINGVPLAFANKIRKGPIGIVGASGTGIQEVSCLIHNFGSGISQAFGTGGRDIKEAINGITMIDCLDALNKANDTEVILIVSKPPCKSVQEKIADFIKNTNKPVICNFAGTTDYSIIEKVGGYSSASLEDAARIAVKLVGIDIDIKEYKGVDFDKFNDELGKLTEKQKYIRGIYGGGSLCYEAIFNASSQLKEDIYSNTPLEGMEKIENVQLSKMHTFLDMGDDEFTVGKPHPMIDPTQKVKRLIKEISDPEVAVVLTDCEIGYGSNEDPAGAIIQALNQAKQIGAYSHAIVITSVCGTDLDFQGYNEEIEKLKNAGVYVVMSNYQAVNLALKVISEKRS